jgi:hypothetical protein
LFEAHPRRPFALAPAAPQPPMPIAPPPPPRGPPQVNGSVPDGAPVESAVSEVYRLKQGETVPGSCVTSGRFKNNTRCGAALGLGCRRGLGAGMPPQIAVRATHRLTRCPPSGPAACWSRPSR